MALHRVARKVWTFEAQLNPALLATVSYATLRSVTVTATFPADQPGLVATKEVETLPKLGVVEFFDRVRHPVLETVPVSDLCERAGQLAELGEPMPPRTCPAMHSAISNEIFMFHQSPLVRTIVLQVRPRVTVHDANQNENEVAVMSALKTHYENPFLSKVEATGTEDPKRTHPSACEG